MLADNGMLYFKLHRKFNNEHILVYVQCDLWGVKFTVGDVFLGFCDNTFHINRPGLESYDVVNTSTLEKKLRVIENIMD